MNYLTLAEYVVLEFLMDHKGEEFTAKDIEKHTGVYASQVDRIIDNLRWKGYDIRKGKHRGVYYIPTNSIFAYFAAALLFATMFILTVLISI